ncbi:hypothetical protein CR513_18613, partial [Mucuna pruriens]
MLRNLIRAKGLQIYIRPRQNNYTRSCHLGHSINEYQGQIKYLIVVVVYFTKWVEVEIVTTISIERVKCFYWKKLILIRFTVGCQLLHTIKNLVVVHFNRAPPIKWVGRGSQQSHPKWLRRRLEEAKGRWIEELP